MCPILARDSFTPYFPFTKERRIQESRLNQHERLSAKSCLRRFQIGRAAKREGGREDRVFRSHPSLRAIENVKDYRVVVEPSLQERGISGELNFPEINYILFFEKCVDYLLLGKFEAFVFFFFLDTSKFCKL